MATEFELKYRCTPEDHSAIREAFPGNWTETPMATTYYDTQEGALSHLRWTLRHRKEGSSDVCTLKTPAPDGARWEWELNCPNIHDAIAHFAAVSGHSELKDLTAKGLVTACGARFTRLSKLLELEGCTAELALDAGVLLAGNRECLLCEAELELKSGSEAALTTFAEDFRQRFHLTIEPKSKFARAKALAQEE